MKVQQANSVEAATGAQWQKLVSSAVAQLTVKQCSNPFHARLEQCVLGSALFTKLTTSSPQILERTVTEDSSRYVDLLQIRSGNCVIERCASSVLLGPGDCFLVDRAKPFGGRISEACGIIFSLPRARVAAVIPDLDDVVGHRIDGRAGWGNALAVLMRQMEISSLIALSQPVGLLTDHVATALALASGCHRANADDGNHMLAKARRLLRDHIDDPLLSPAKAASLLGISKRYLHLLFADQNTTFSRELNTLRMRLAHDLLLNPTFADVPLATIALRCGYLDYGTFRRHFNIHFDMSPSDLRQRGDA